MRTKPYSERIRATLRKCPEGMTAQEIAADYRLHHQHITSTLKRMPDAYIADWVKVREGAPGRKSALWKVVVPPPNARNVR